MFSLNRWWERYRSTFVLGSLGLGAAFFLRQTNAASLVEIYRLLSLPFQTNVAAQDQNLQARTWELQQRLVELEQQNQQLRRLLNQPEISQQRGVAAQVIGRTADHWWQQLTLGQGENRQIKVDAPVMAPGGVLGRITSVTANTSRVLLLTDPTSSVAVNVGKHRQTGIMRGQANQRAVIEFLVKDPKVRPGDVVLTSNLSSLFPAGLPVGKVVSVDLRNLAKPLAIVELAAPIDQVEWVTITLNAQSPPPTPSPSP
jgi:rod shape-determining protein MreC